MQNSCQHLDQVILECILLSLSFHICASVSYSNITIQTLQDVRMGKNMTICCIAQQWSGFQPTLRLIISTTIDEETKTPTRTVSRDYKFCFEFLVNVDYHQSVAQCVATYGEDGEGKRRKSFSVSLVLRAFTLNYEMKVKTVSNGDKLSRVYTCLCTASYKKPEELTVTWYINKQVGHANYPEKRSTQFLGNIAGDRQTIPYYSVISKVTIANEQQSDVTSIYCEAHHAFQGLLTNTTTVPNPSQGKHGNSAITRATTTTTTSATSTTNTIDTSTTNITDTSTTTTTSLPEIDGEPSSSRTLAFAMAASSILAFLAVAGALFFVNRRKRQERVKRSSRRLPDSAINIDMGYLPSGSSPHYTGHARETFSRSSRHDLGYPRKSGNYSGFSPDEDFYSSNVDTEEESRYRSSSMYVR